MNAKYKLSFGSREMFQNSMVLMIAQPCKYIYFLKTLEFYKSKSRGV